MNKLRVSLVVVFLCSSQLLQAADIFKAVCKVEVNGSLGSGTLVAVSEHKALVLTCRHVVMKKGNIATLFWPYANDGKGFRTPGRVLAVGKDQDIAMVGCPRPPGIEYVPIRLPHPSHNPMINIGFPGPHRTLSWNAGSFIHLTHTRLRYSVRPVEGMSGGGTFDKEGYLVGVIIEKTVDGYYPPHGASSSGPAMFEFLHQFKVNSGIKSPPSVLHYK